MQSKHGRIINVSSDFASIAGTSESTLLKLVWSAYKLYQTTLAEMPAIGFLSAPSTN
jgi:hypothetical protein